MYHRCLQMTGPLLALIGDVGLASGPQRFGMSVRDWAEEWEAVAGAPRCHSTGVDAASLVVSIAMRTC
jgi:hypothetical protein